MNESQRLDTLLGRIKNTLVQSKEFEKMKGENFNVFMVLNKQRDEVKTHSAFISELLNPKGSHGMGNVFLGHFFNILIEKGCLDPTIIDCLDETIVDVEKYVGNILDINSRLDIYISNKNAQICIENKIHAKDQIKQLERYKEFLIRNKHKNNLLIYLSLFGKDYQETDLENGSDYICLSYKDDILDWLKECLKESVDYPILRESIKQYIVLIKSLTNQLMSDKMQKQVHQIILSDIESSLTIKSEYDKAIKQITSEFRSQIIATLKTIFSEKPYTFEPKEWNQFFSIFITSPKEEYQIGIESFNGQGHYDGILFIGAFDCCRKDKDIHYIKGGWINGTIEPIWNNATLFQKLQGFANGTVHSREQIIKEIVKKIEEYIIRHWEVRK